MIRGLVTKNYSDKSAFSVIIRNDQAQTNPVVYRARYPEEGETLEQYLRNELFISPSSVLAVHRSDAFGLSMGTTSSQDPESWWQMPVHTWTAIPHSESINNLLLIVNNSTMGDIMKAMLLGDAMPQVCHLVQEGDESVIMRPPDIPAVGGFLIQPEVVPIYTALSTSPGMQWFSLTGGRGYERVDTKPGTPVELPLLPRDRGDGISVEGFNPWDFKDVVAAGERIDDEKMRRIVKVHFLGTLVRGNKLWLIHGGVYRARMNELSSACKKMAAYGYRIHPIVEHPGGPREGTGWGRVLIPVFDDVPPDA